jgi:hypothetical protein
LSQISRSFCFGYFGDKVSLFAQARLDHNPKVYFKLPGLLR